MARAGKDFMSISRTHRPYGRRLSQTMTEVCPMYITAITRGVVRL